MSETKKTEPEERPLSVNERQAADADQKDRRAQEGSTGLNQRAILAVRALELANEQGESPENTVKRARQYREFLEEQDG
jgi:hypothetical protein